MCTKVCPIGEVRAGSAQRCSLVGCVRFELNHAMHGRSVWDRKTELFRQEK
jgi:hypothetical protein